MRRQDTGVLFSLVFVPADTREGKHTPVRLQGVAKCSIDDEEGGVWEAQCTLLLWLAILVLLPFNMASMDSSLGDATVTCALNPVPLASPAALEETCLSDQPL